MGLDMYLTAEKHTDQPIKIGKTPGEVCGVSCLVQSWRKANQIHNWFVTHVQGGQYRDWETDRKSTRLNSSHSAKSRMPSSA